MSNLNIMDYKVFIGELDTLNLEKKQVINTINPHSYITAKSDEEFERALQNSDFLIADGSGIVFAAQRIHKRKIKKVAGADLHVFLLKKLNKESGKVFYMGASEETLVKIREKINKEYPNILMKSYSPPFKKEFSDQDNEVILSKINSFKPDVLFIGMTAPKQEKWLHEHRNKLHFKTASSIGAVFDFYAGTIVRPSKFWVDMHLEWLARFLKEPRRLWRRNFVSTPLFLLDILKHKR